MRNNRFGEWRKHPLFQDYELSEKGDIRRRKVTFRAIKSIGEEATLYVNGRQTRIKIATLMAEAYLGPRPAGHVVAFRDQNRHNREATNLYYRPGRQRGRPFGSRNRPKPPMVEVRPPTIRELLEGL